MGILPMVEKGGNCLRTEALPLFYMNDFSVLGLLVDHLAPAMKALESRGFQIVREQGAVQIKFDGHRQMVQIVETLDSAQIPFQLTDLFDHAYQG